MKLKLLLILFCMAVFGLNGAQALTRNESDMLEFIHQIRGAQKIGIYHNGQDWWNNKSLPKIMHAFIEKEVEKKEYYLVYDREMHTYVQNETWGVEEKNIKTLCPDNSNKNGLILYRTYSKPNDKTYFSSCIQEIRSLMQGGWIVCVDVHEEQFARDLSKEFCNEKKEVLIKGYAKDNFLSRVLVIGGVFFIFALLYSKFVVPKK